VEVLGDEKVEGLKIKNTKTGKVSEEKFGGLFVAIGHKPNTGFLESSGIDLDEKGYVKVGERSRTSVEGVFAGGDIHDYVYRQAVTAAGEGCRAAMDAERWLSEKEAK
jgi:thioredoxin reductase (NADPH)